MNNLPLQPLAWTTESDTPSAKSPLYYYDIIREYSCGESCFVRYQKVEAGCNIKQATGFSSFDEAKAWAWKHYNEKMQPYVKPMPTWINYKTEKPKEGDDVVITWLWMSVSHTIHLGNYSPRKIDYLDDAIEVYWSISPFVKQGE